MMRKYISAAMRHACYKILPEDESYYGEIPGFDGVWANASNLEDCRDELEEAVEDWILLGVALGHELPEVDGLTRRIREVA